MTEIPVMMIEKTPLAFRHELKHLITPAEDRIVSERLGRLFQRDSHAGPDGTYWVNSLYFDTPEDKAFLQKIHGVNEREKFRIRYYGDAPEFLRLEKKIKKGGNLMEYILQTNNLSKVYGTKTVLNDVSIHVPKGSMSG